MNKSLAAANLNNERERKQRKENEKLLNEQRDRRRMEAKKNIRLKQHQERVEHVRNAIVSTVT